MELHIKRYDELKADELYEILKVRMEVFVVEQDCRYQDMDGRDKNAYHLFMTEDGEIKAYLRVLDKGVSFDEVSIGRVLSVKRRCGLATELVKAGIEVAKEKYAADKIVIEAQTYVEKLYEKLGFVRISDEFLDVGIPHVKMELNL